jgi:hypothetical protein
MVIPLLDLKPPNGPAVLCPMMSMNDGHSTFGFEATTRVAAAVTRAGIEI